MVFGKVLGQSGLKYPVMGIAGIAMVGAHRNIDLVIVVVEQVGAHGDTQQQSCKFQSCVFQNSKQTYTTKPAISISLKPMNFELRSAPW